jgi:hypothetical protein
LKSRGRYLANGHERDGEIVWWGEWEPESDVVARLSPTAPGEPRFLYQPYYTPQTDYRRLQNTDPFVFGKQFHYTGCLQHTSKGETQLRHLDPGSLILFGSCNDRSRFVLDTVFVVARRKINHTKRDFRRKLEYAVSSTYRKVTIEPWYSGSVPGDQSHWLYFGATPANPVAGTFSYFPCCPYSGPQGFARPTISIPGYITDNLNQGKKIRRDLDLGELADLWRNVADQVRQQGLDLGIYAALPPCRDSTSSATRRGRSSISATIC